MSFKIPMKRGAGSKIQIGQASSIPNSSISGYQSTTSTFFSPHAQVKLNKKTFGGNNTVKILRFLGRTETDVMEGEIKLEADQGGSPTILGIITVSTANIDTHHELDITSAINALAEGVWTFTSYYRVSVSDSTNRIHVKDTYIEIY